MKLIALFFIFAFVSQSSFARDAKGPDAQAINAACANDAATASCGSEKVGTGLLRCLHAYKRSHADFKFSDACKEAVLKARRDIHK